jgi:hypothetical protein
MRNLLVSEVPSVYYQAPLMISSLLPVRVCFLIGALPVHVKRVHTKVVVGTVLSYSQILIKYSQLRKLSRSPEEIPHIQYLEPGHLCRLSMSPLAQKVT